jgi:ubiquinone/menaquinone biosynthesis C-methylase UbiE
MDLGEARQREVFFTLHSGLPREGPGDRQSTARALGLAAPLPAAAQVLDIACGPGAQTMDLADLLPDATITALDLHEPFVRETRRRARERGVDGRVRAMQGDMTALALPAASFDLIWCEGAAYIMGVGAALRAWRPLLKPGGRLALTEAVWLRREAPEPVRRLFAEYPAMGDLAAARALVGRSGYRLLGDFVLPQAAWMTDYYEPLRRRLAELAPHYADDPAARAVLAESAEEIAVFERYGDWYGYVFLVMTPIAESRP